VPHVTSPHPAIATLTKKQIREHGKLVLEVDLVDGVPHGVQRRWYLDGSLRSETPFVHGVVHGERVEYFPNGKVALRQTVKHDLLDGVVQQFDPSGRLLGEFTMVEGTGTYKTWDRSGRLESEVDLLKGGPHGLSILYSASGRSSVAYCLNGMRVTRKRYEEACAADPSLRPPPKPRIRRKASQAADKA
jgi:antitoxin component YwqK of YwqJK toxin-antitoxin module